MFLTAEIYRSMPSNRTYLGAAPLTGGPPPRIPPLGAPLGAPRPRPRGAPSGAPWAWGAPGFSPFRYIISSICCWWISSLYSWKTQHICETQIPSVDLGSLTVWSPTCPAITVAVYQVCSLCCLAFYGKMLRTNIYFVPTFANQCAHTFFKVGKTELRMARKALMRTWTCIIIYPQGRSLHVSFFLSYTMLFCVNKW